MMGDFSLCGNKIICLLLAFLFGSRIIHVDGGGQCYVLIQPTKVNILSEVPHDAVGRQFPWVVSIQRFRKPGWDHICAGILIAEQWVLTSSYCAYTARFPFRFRAAINKHNLALNEPAELYVHLHTQFTLEVSADGDHDITKNGLGLFKLHHPRDYKKRPYVPVTPICLPRTNHSMVTGNNCHIAGWGITSTERVEDGSPVDILQHIEVTYVMRGDCQKKLGSLVTLSEFHFCALVNEEIRVTLSDSGDGLFCSQDENYFFAGVMVHVYSEKPNLPIFLQAGAYRNWIRAKQYKADEVPEDPSDIDDAVTKVDGPLVPVPKRTW